MSASSGLWAGQEINHRVGKYAKLESKMFNDDEEYDEYEEYDEFEDVPVSGQRAGVHSRDT
jgi:hypothetical protein